MAPSVSMPLSTSGTSKNVDPASTTPTPGTESAPGSLYTKMASGALDNPAQILMNAAPGAAGPVYSAFMSVPIAPSAAGAMSAPEPVLRPGVSGAKSTIVTTRTTAPSAPSALAKIRGINQSMKGGAIVGVAVGAAQAGYEYFVTGTMTGGRALWHIAKAGAVGALSGAAGGAAAGAVAGGIGCAATVVGAPVSPGCSLAVGGIGLFVGGVTGFATHAVIEYAEQNAK